MKLSVVIVSWNVREKLENNLSALFESKVNFDFEVFVVDNNSTDQTADMVKEKFPKVRLIANSDNLGFSKANNQAIRQAKGEHILLLNPDMRVLPDTFEKMITWFELHPQAFVASCKLLDDAGNIIPHVRRFPSFWDQLAIVLKIPHLMPGVLNKYLAKDFNYDLPGKVDSVRGSFFLMRRPANKLPLLDERYFIWFEEVDYCRQIRNSGYEIWYNPDVSCIDYVGASFAQVQRVRTQSYFEDSMLKYFKKWHPAWQHNFLKLAWPLGKLIAITASGLKIKNKKVT